MAPRPPTPPSSAPLPSNATQAEAARLRRALANDIPAAVRASRQSEQRWIELAKATLAASPYRIKRPQLVVTVDRAPRVQELMILLVQPNNQPWEAIGGSRISTGQAGRRTYFITPTGVFRHTTDIIDYRALGTYNENHIRGLGVKGMRVWDFGWQTARKGWLPEDDTGEIRLLMHATDPDVLEQRLGRPASQGCVRVPASMNRFLDRYGVLDADYERAAADEPRLAAVLLPDRTPSFLAGSLLVVVDFAQPGAEAARNHAQPGQAPHSPAHRNGGRHTPSPLRNRSSGLTRDQTQRSATMPSLRQKFDRGARSVRLLASRQVPIGMNRLGSMTCRHPKLVHRGFWWGLPGDWGCGR